MADEPVDLTHRLLRDIRATQEGHTCALGRIEKRVDDLYTMSTHTLGVAVSAHEKFLALEAPVEQLSERVQRLESKA